MTEPIKVAVTGAAGQIGYALLFRIASGAMFGMKTPVHLSLLELEPALPALEGVAMELADCAFPLLAGVSLSSDPRQAFADADWALLVGSVPRKAGMERSDLLKVNGTIFVQQGRALDVAAKRSCRVLVVGNPCNTNAYIAKAFAPGLSGNNFFALTMLDQNRAIAQLAHKAQVPVSEVRDLMIWGNHSATMFPDFFQARIKGNPATDAIKDEVWLKEDFMKTVQGRGAAIIRARGASSAASAANAVVDTVRRLTGRDYPGWPFSVAVSSDGSYGVDEGLIFSFPVIAEQSGWRIKPGIQHNDFSREKIKETLEELRREKDVATQAGE